MGLHTEKETIIKVTQRFGTVSNGWWVFLCFSGSFYRRRNYGKSGTEVYLQYEEQK
ncbi:MAG: hypothetical protein QG641_1681 [Candidatus Poribacteria bacterium]|nr:hypothetical protein [Candidatus Poribacteria bacterium]